MSCQRLPYLLYSSSILHELSVPFAPGHLLTFYLEAGNRKRWLERRLVFPGLFAGLVFLITALVSIGELSLLDGSLFSPRIPLLYSLFPVFPSLGDPTCPVLLPAYLVPCVVVNPSTLSPPPLYPFHVESLRSHVDHVAMWYECMSLVIVAVCYSIFFPSLSRAGGWALVRF